MSKSTIKSIGLYILTYRSINGVSQKEFAKLLGMSRQYLCCVEKGRKGISLARVPAVAKAMGCDELFLAELCLQEMLDKAGLGYKIYLERKKGNE